MKGMGWGGGGGGGEVCHNPGAFANSSPIFVGKVGKTAMKNMHHC